MREYYTVELDDYLHIENEPHALPWAVYKRSIAHDYASQETDSFISDIWVADCATWRIAKILVECLTANEILDGK